jgi:hypothetical protein
VAPRFTERISLKVRTRLSRNQRGSIIAVGVALLVVLIPIAVLTYDLTLIRQQYNQLKAATDSAALAAAVWASNPENISGSPQAVNDAAEMIALPYFSANGLATGPKYGGSLHDAEVATSDISTESLHKLGQSRLYVTVDATTSRVVAESDFCIQPSLMSMFGLYTLHARSVAGPGNGAAGDVVFAVDLSASMTLSSPRGLNVVRTHPKRVREVKELKTTNIIHRFSIPGHLALEAPAPSSTDPLVMPNQKLHLQGENLHPYCARGYIDNWFNPQIPNVDAIDFTPNPNPTNYHPSAPIPTPVLPNTKAPRLVINTQNTPLLYALMNDFASKDPNVPITLNYPNWPAWPPVNPQKPYTYFDVRGSSAPPTSAELQAGIIYDGSDPSHLPYNDSTPVRIKSFQLVTIPEMMTYVLLAAKEGFLADQAAFDKAMQQYPEVLFTIKTYFPKLGTAALPFSNDYRREYQKLSMCITQPVETQVSIMHDIIESFAGSSDAPHWSLVGFGQFAPGTGRRPGQRPPSNEQTPPYDYTPLDKRKKPRQPDEFQFPLVPLDAGRLNDKEVLAVIDEATVSYGTATPEALQEGIDQLNGNGHRQGKNKTLILLTDGIPTMGGSFNVIKTNKKRNHPGIQGIRLIAVGLFEGSYPCPGGPRFLTKLVKKAGQGAVLYPYRDLTRNCGKLAGDPSVDLHKDATDIANFVKKSLSGGGSIGLIE